MATQIKTIIDKFLKDTKNKKTKQNNIEKAIHKIFKQKTYRHIHLGAINKNKLVLYTDSSVVGYKIQLLKNKIIENKEIKEYKIKDIIIKVKNGKKQQSR